jgi:Flp pilus assembly pilin Flp
MKTLIARFLRNRSGATFIEYAAIATLISIVAIAAIANIGVKTKNNLTPVSNGVN